MVAYRKHSSGKWQAAVSLPQRLPNGKPRRVTKTHVLKGVVRDWGTKLEAEIAAGTWSDPRSGDLVLSEWHKEWHAGRVAAGSTTRKDDSHWRVHVEPRWGGHPLNTITNRDLRLWIVEMHERQCRWCRACPKVNGQRTMSPHRGPDGTPCQGNAQPPGLPGPTVRGAVTTLSSVLSAAVRAGLLPANPATGLKLPRVDAKPIFWWTRDEAGKILAQLEGSSRLMVDLDLHCGLRLGELLGLKRKYVQANEDGKLLIHVVGVQTRDGWREYPKSVMSRRTIPVPVHLQLALGDYIAGPQDAPVFPAPDGGAWDDRNWARRVFEPAVAAAGVRRGTPHDMRHTAASWLVQKGVFLYVVQGLLGHESFKTTQRYAHLAPESFEKVIRAWEDME
jgi:integrase